ncbi:FAD:protein FMN transferase [Neiella marina]|uniref:FAD:protein FMN transferase n=1 Tax=Neiella holothuriorum TaxID=2870530 RepID=A0ABS7EHG0_9GAMM|nr:FAD:protein FMN transferase [Neiella holothuriorum]MBW8191776.1 FAD:protein FMN transferase [Neiella holothuriorum]
MTKPQKLLWLALVGLAIFLFWWQLPPKLEQIEIQGSTMGTYYVVKLVVPDADAVDGEAIKQQIDARLIDLNRSMSTYDPESELSAFNQSDSTEAVVVSNQLGFVLDEAIRLGELSKGALDVTVGPLVNLWGFGPEGRPEKVPTDEDIKQARVRVGLEKIELSGTGLRKFNDGVYVDLSAIAKGYGVDEVADLVLHLGFANAMIDIGGELRVAGYNQQCQPWRVAIEKPVSTERAVQQVVDVSDIGMATSGDYRNYFEQDGQRFSHTIDPATAKPISHKLVSVTVLHPSSMTADGLATALMVMGDEKGLAWAEAIELPVYMIVKTATGFEAKYSAAMAAYLVD